MTSRILSKRSVVPGKVPTTAQIDLGELAINTRDGKLFLKRDNGNGAFTIVEVGSPQAVASSLGLGAFAYGSVGDWTVSADPNGNLRFFYDGIARMRLDPNGNLTVSGDITAFGAP
jgi:hypothetical protein